jgi:dihydroxyacid dehydratase/phosphogluconate dehydratase
MGSGMEETYQITSALKFLKWGREVAVVTDARFSGVSTVQVKRSRSEHR